MKNVIIEMHNAAVNRYHATTISKYADAKHIPKSKKKRALAK